MSKVPVKALAFAAIGGLAVFAMSQSASAASRELRLLVWEGYTEPQWVETFEEEFDAKVKFVYLADAADQWTKIKASDGADYDLVSMSTSDLRKFYEHGLLRPIDTSKLPNIKNQLPHFQDLTLIPDAIQDDGQVYGIPFAYGAHCLIYDVDRVVPAPTSWNVFWDPKYEGQVITRDDGSSNLSMTAISMGHERPHHLDDQELTEVRGKLETLMPNLLGYYSSIEDAAQMWESGDGVLLYATECEFTILAFKDYNVKTLIPDEGAQAWLDLWSVVKGVEDEELAYAWIDYFLSNEVQKMMTDDVGYANTNFEPEDGGFTGKVMHMQEPVESFQGRTDIWNEIKASQ